jgi:hypothetical protein
MALVGACHAQSQALTVAATIRLACADWCLWLSRCIDQMDLDTPVPP